MEVMNDIKVEKYSEYKDSGEEWLGEIPKHWNLSRLGVLLTPISIRNRVDLPLLSITREKAVILRDIENENGNHNFIPDDLSNYKVLKKGQFGMNKMKAWQGSYGISDYDGIVSPAYFIFDLKNTISPKYFHAAIRSKLYVSFFGSASDGVRIGQWDLSKERMKQIPFLIPPIKEQTAIAEFLDRKTASIDQAIDIKEKQIQLLKERRQIIIHQAVTRGLNPKVKMKDSGVEWIGEVPEHWEIKALRFIGKTQNGLSKGGEYFGTGFPFLTYGDVYKDIQLPNELSGLAESSIQDQQQFSILEGDVFFTRTSETVEEIGFSSTSMNTIGNATFAGFLIRFRPDKKILFKGFSKFYFSSKTHRSFFIGEMNLVIRASLSQELLKKMPVLIPPIKEQIEISEFLEEVFTKINSSISLKEKEIEKLKEYKSTLINSAVTGKIKVC